MRTKVLSTGAVTALLCALGASPASADTGGDVLAAASQDRNDVLYVFTAKQSHKAQEFRITNPPAGQIVGLDRRPADQVLHLSSKSGTAGTISTVTLDTATRTATLTPKNTFSVPLAGQFFGSDFNPVPDALRTINDAEQNLRTPMGGSGATVQDGAINYPDGRPVDAVAAAYTNNDTDPATGTALYDIDAANDLLALQSPPNAGTLQPVGPLGLEVERYAGFDITPPAAGATPYAALLPTRKADKGSHLYTIDLATGRATDLGRIGKDGARIDSLAYVG
jgi:hypothetical protein